jgi:hypothetical protein
MLTILSLCLAGVGVYLAWLTIQEARKTSRDQDSQFTAQMKHQNEQFNAQMKQLRASASAFVTATGLLKSRSDIMAKQGSAQTLASQSLRLSPCHDPRFWALIAVAACSQKVDVYHVKNRRL